MKKVLLCLLLVLSLLLIPMAMLPMVGVNPPPASQSQLTAPVADIGQVVSAPAIDKQTSRAAGVGFVYFAVSAILLTAAGVAVVRKKPLHSRPVSQALDRTAHSSTTLGGAGIRPILNCPT